MVITINTWYALLDGEIQTFIYKKKRKKKAKQEHAETNQRGHTHPLTTAVLPQGRFVWFRLTAQGNCVCVCVCVKERVPFIESINTRLTFYRAIYLAEYTMNNIYGWNIYWYHIGYYWPLFQFGLNYWISNSANFLFFHLDDLFLHLTFTRSYYTINNTLIIKKIQIAHTNVLRYKLFCSI